ncbi:hypothetical protein RI129_008896 [Pyrocoelia pectoralis]|uniref:Uncharacterized protein n=1 Tax=Pyrocoelia pectoralis TaxID=417401 RepID=A0AAN7VAP8_9COLE
MDKIVTENLFLLEFLVDNVHLDSSVVRGVGDVPGDTCVSVQFLDNPPLDICEDDFAPRRRYSQDCSNVKSGKSCLFSLTPTQANNALHQFDVYVTVFKKMQQSGESSEKVQVGTSLISIVNLFTELIASVSMPANENGPTAKTLKDTFQIVNDVGQYVGDIGMYIRMSCFGKLIVTQFQMNLDDKSVLFKDKEGHSLYRYKKAGQNNEARPPSTSCPTCASGSPQGGGNSVASIPPGCYQEIGASMGANALTIRVHKDKKLESNPTDGDDDPCTCSNTYQTSRNDQSRAHGGGSCCNQEQRVAMRPGYEYGGNSNTPFSFKLGGCAMNGQNNVTVVPPVSTTADGTQYTEISDPDRDVFILRIGKKSERADKKNNLELELCTPKGPDIKPTPKKETRDTQWEDACCDGGSAGGGGKGGKGKGKK